MFIEGDNSPPPESIPNPVNNDESIPNPAYTIWYKQDKFIFGALIVTLTPIVTHIVSKAKKARVIWHMISDSLSFTLRGR